jgi:hypothetical protein
VLVVLAVQILLQPQLAEVLLSFHLLPLLVGVVGVIKEDTILVQAQPEVLVVQVVVELLGEGLTPVALGTLHLYPHLREAMVAMVLKAPQQILLGVAVVAQVLLPQIQVPILEPQAVMELHLLLAAHP